MICVTAGIAAAQPADTGSPATCGTIRVGLSRAFGGVNQITVLASSDYTVAAIPSNGSPVSCTNLEPVTISAGAKTMTLKRPNGVTADIGASVCILPTDPAGTLIVDSPRRSGRQYYGTLEVSLKSGCLSLVNRVGVDDYLVGVLAGEMPSSYPLEALKAQAVAARNYALQSLGKHSSSGYDLCDGPHCQVYDGALRETAILRQAVLTTANQVLTYDGKLASTMYCSDCGGVTECYREANKDDAPYLATVVEPSEIAHGAWKKTYTLDDLSARLLAAGIKQADGLQRVSVAKTSSSGRALIVSCAGTKGTFTIDGARLRTILGRDALRSTLFSIDSSQSGTITFSGKGSGHGVGLCQIGAKALASPPFNYTFDQILAHYYPGTKLTGDEVRIDPPRKSAQSGNATKPAQKSQGAALAVRVVAPRL